MRPSLSLSVLLGGALLVQASCQSRSAAPVALPETSYAAGHQAALSLIPSRAVLTFSVGKLAHLLDRLRATRAVVSAGPVGKKYVDQLLALATAKLGFDPLADEKWRDQGLDLDGPFVFAYLADDKGVLVVRALPDAGPKAASFLAKGLDDPATKCEPSDAFVVCFDAAAMPLVKQVDQSIWATASKQIDAETQKMALLVYANLSAMPNLKEAPVDYFKQSQAAFFGIGLEKHAVRYRAGYLNPDTKELFPYFELDPNAPSLLSALRAGPNEHCNTRLGFNPKALWELAKRKIPPEEFDKAVAGFTVVTGLDADKDIVQNFTGELTLSWSGASMFALLGVREDATAARLVERLDGLIGTGLAAIQNLSALKVERSTAEVLGKKVFSYKLHVELPGSAPFDLQIDMTTGKGALVLGFDAAAAKRAIERLADRKGKEAFLAGLPAEARAPFSTPRSSVAYIAPSYLPALRSATLLKLSREIYVKMGPEFAQGFDEYIAVWDLIYDGFFGGNVDAGGIFVYGWMNLL